MYADNVIHGVNLPMNIVHLLQSGQLLVGLCALIIVFIG